MAVFIAILQRRSSTFWQPHTNEIDSYWRDKRTNYTAFHPKSTLKTFYLERIISEVLQQMLYSPYENMVKQNNEILFLAQIILLVAV